MNNYLHLLFENSEGNFTLFCPDNSKYEFTGCELNLENDTVYLEDDDDDVVLHLATREVVFINLSSSSVKCVHIG